MGAANKCSASTTPQFTISKILTPTFLAASLIQGRLLEAELAPRTSAHWNRTMSVKTYKRFCTKRILKKSVKQSKNLRYLQNKKRPMMVLPLLKNWKRQLCFQRQRSRMRPGKEALYLSSWPNRAIPTPTLAPLECPEINKDLFSHSKHLTQIIRKKTPLFL